MKETLEKILDLGIGTIAYSKDKITDFVNDLVDRGEIQKEEAAAVVAELVDRGKQENEKRNGYTGRSARHYPRRNTARGVTEIGSADFFGR